MNSKFLILWVMMIGLLFAPWELRAEPAIINDIVVDTQNGIVRVTISSSQTLQIETFKNEESPANYIVLDFLGAVYTKLPPVIDVGKGAVEKVSLVRGEDNSVKIGEEEYYALDFLAINLNAKADYQVRQSQSVIDLDIATVAVPGGGSDDASVELTPPIVVSKQNAPQSLPETANAVEQISAEEEYASAGETDMESVSSEKPIVEKKKRKGLFRKIFSSKKEKKTLKKAEEPLDAQKKAEKKSISTAPAQSPAVSSSSPILIDSIVNDTIREQEQISSRIENLTLELQRLQEELNISKGEKSKLDGKINEIMAKLDELKSALDDEISRRQALGEKVGDIVAKRDAYVKAKNLYESLSKQLGEINGKVENLNTETQIVKNRLDVVQFEKKKLENDVSAITASYTQVQSDYDAAIAARNSISLKIEQLTQELEALRQKLDNETLEKAKVAGQLKSLEGKSKYNSTELSRLKQLLLDKNTQLTDLSQQYEQLKAALDSAVSEKSAMENSYRNAKTEFERIKQEIETMLNRKN